MQFAQSVVLNLNSSFDVRCFLVQFLLFSFDVSSRAPAQFEMHRAFVHHFATTKTQTNSIKQFEYVNE
jgi:hypothetical protein